LTIIPSPVQVKVLGCDGSGTYDGVIEGISWTANQAQKRGRPSAANMSLGGGKSTIVNTAVAGTRLPLTTHSHLLPRSRTVEANSTHADDGLQRPWMRV
jgi:hypothetical protein